MVYFLKGINHAAMSRAGLKKKGPHLGSSSLSALRSPVMDQKMRKECEGRSAIADSQVREPNSKQREDFNCKTATGKSSKLPPMLNRSNLFKYCKTEKRGRRISIFKDIEKEKKKKK